MPIPSAAVAVIVLMPSTARIASSIFWQIPSSTSAGLAPGYSTPTVTISSWNSGNNSFFSPSIAITPTMMTATISVLTAGPLRTTHWMIGFTETLRSGIDGRGRRGQGPLSLPVPRLLGDRRWGLRYGRSPTISLPRMVPRARQLVPAIVSLMNRTEPSANRVLTPPGWKLRLV